MSVIALGSLGLGINVWLCQVKDSTIYNAATKTNPKKLQVSCVKLCTKTLPANNRKYKRLLTSQRNKYGRGNSGDGWVQPVKS